MVVILAPADLTSSPTRSSPCGVTPALLDYMLDGDGIMHTVCMGTRECTPSIALRDIAQENWRDALALSLDPAQLRFVSDTTYPVALTLAKAYIQPGGLPVAPFGIYTGAEMVGFFALTYEPNSVDRYLLMHFLIDRRHQRRGYGMGALHALVALLRERFPTCESVSLTVHPDNHPAQRLYIRFGFEDTGTRLFGEPCYRLRVPCLRQA